jgi:hypothetical protein
VTTGVVVVWAGVVVVADCVVVVAAVAPNEHYSSYCQLSGHCHTHRYHRSILTSALLLCVRVASYVIGGCNGFNIEMAL